MSLSARKHSLVALTIGVAAAITLFALRGHSATESPLSTLVAASSRDWRTVEPRLTGGFAWAPVHKATRGSWTRDLRFESMLAKLAGTPGDAADSRHATGIAQLLSGKYREALASLSVSAEFTGHPGAWSDLAAAYYETAARNGAPELFAEALAACDRALSVDPRHAEALFNRALVIEKLGLRNEAHIAWQSYLEEEATSGWADEAREHLRNTTAMPPFLDAFDRDYRRFAVDPPRIGELTRRDPQEARARTEMQLLGRWGRTFAAGDFEGAEQQLLILREIGHEVARINGDRMVEHAVAAIDAADASTRSILAAAHVDYDAGLRSFQNNRPVEAEPLLRRAAIAFERGRSPMALTARYFVANTAFEQQRTDEAQRQLERLLATAPQDLRAYRAQLLWQLGICQIVRASWGAAIHALEESTNEFERLGEVANAGSVRRLIAYSYDRIGDPDSAWKYRMIALAGIGAHTNRVPLQKALAAIALSAMTNRRWPTAVSFLNLEIGIAQSINDDLQLAEALLIRAAVHYQLHDITRAAFDLGAADAVIARLKDPAYAEYVRTERLGVRAMLATTPTEATALLSDAIAFHSTKGERATLPGLFLQRGRAFRQGGDRAASAADFQRGIKELEKHRDSLPQGDARWGAFHADEELFEEATDLAMEEGDAAAAFAIAETSRARALLDSYGRTPSLDFGALPADTIVVEYVALASRVIIFTASSEGVSAVANDFDRTTLKSRIDEMVSALRTDQQMAARRAGSELYRLLLQPVAEQLPMGSTVVFVPDATTARVPFHALVDGDGKYFVESYTPLIAPSAATFAAAAERRNHASTPRTVLVVANSRPDADAAALRFVADEANRVAREYSRSIRLQDDEAQIDAIARRAEEADVIHIAGHAVGDDSGFEPASIALRDVGGERRLSVAEIAKFRFRRPSLVVLAGCNTGRGERRGAEGVISVAHGFLTAGVPSVIATQWSIEDESAARFFPRLHDRLTDGLSPAAALREVQLDAIHRGDVPTSLWAAIQDIGS